MRLIDFFDRGVALAPNRTCIEDSSVRRTYAEVQRRSCRIANALAAEGFRPGQKAGILSPNCAAAVEVMVGVFRSGLVWVPVNSSGKIDEHCDIFDACDVEILFYHGECAPSLEELKSRCTKVRYFVCLDEPGGMTVSLEDWIATASDVDPDIPLAPDDLVAIVPSGGTTGKPKGIVHTQLTWTTVIANLYSTVDVGSDVVHLVTTPISHAAGVLTIALFAAGARNVILKRFAAATVIGVLEAEGVTHLFLPPTAIYMLLAEPGLKMRHFPKLRGFFYAGAPMAVDALRRCLEVFGPVMIQTFGQAEAPMFCTILTAEDHDVLGTPARAHRLASCGRATLLTPVAIMDDEGNILPRGERGEIVVRGGLVMKCYYKDPQATAAVSQFGWHHTGDVGMIDRDGFVYIVDRKKEMIISGGFNIYPSEIEQIIWAHQAVQDCAVIGVPDAKWGEAVKAVLQLRPGASVEPEEIMSLCKERLGSIKAPKSVEIWQNLPRTAAGKVNKKEIRETFWKAESRQI